MPEGGGLLGVGDGVPPARQGGPPLAGEGVVAVRAAARAHGGVRLGAAALAQQPWRAARPFGEAMGALLRILTNDRYRPKMCRTCACPPEERAWSRAQ
jgi:hypothetical protein